jgi:hypothetical protein
MRRRRKTLQVSTFPFLAVLLCTMGALILVLVAMDRQSRLAAQQKAQEEAQRVLDDQVKVLADRRSEYEAKKRTLRQVWEGKRDALLARVGAEEAALQAELKLIQARLAKAARRVDDEEGDVARLREKLQDERARLLAEQKALDDARKDADAMARKATSTDRTRAQLAGELERLEKSLKEMKESRKRDANTYSVIPYFGKRGENRRPIYVECAEGVVIFHPDRQQLSEACDADVKEQLARRAAAQRRRMAAAGAQDARPYVMLLVRPNGVRCYYQVQSALRELGVEYGYEFVDADWILQAPADDALPPPADQVAVVSTPPIPVPRPNPAGPVGTAGTGLAPPSGAAGGPGGAAGGGTGSGAPGPRGSGAGPVGTERSRTPGRGYGPVGIDGPVVLGGGWPGGQGSGTGTGIGVPGGKGSGGGTGAGAPGGQGSGAGTTGPGGGVPGGQGSGTGTGTGVPGGRGPGGGTGVGMAGVAGGPGGGGAGMRLGGDPSGWGPRGNGTGAAAGGPGGLFPGSGGGNPASAGLPAGSAGLFPGGPGGGSGSSTSLLGGTAALGTGTGGSGAGAPGVGPGVPGGPGGTGGGIAGGLPGSGSSSGIGAQGGLAGGVPGPGGAGGGPGVPGAPGSGTGGPGLGGGGDQRATVGLSPPMPYAAGGAGASVAGAPGAGAGTGNGAGGGPAAAGGPGEQGVTAPALVNSPNYGKGGGNARVSASSNPDSSDPTTPVRPDPADESARQRSWAGSDTKVDPTLPLARGGGGGGGRRQPSAFAPEGPPVADEKPRPERVLRPALLGGEGTHVIFVECQADRIVIYPSRRVVGIDSLNHTPAYNPLFKDVQEMIARRTSNLAPGERRPHLQVRFLVHPDGEQAMHLAYPVLDALPVEKVRVSLQPEDKVERMVSGN